MYAFLDLETTGTDPVKDRILQVAVQLVSSGLKLVGGGFSTDIALSETAAGRLYTTPVVLDMHAATGLLGRLQDDMREKAKEPSVTVGLPRLGVAESMVYRHMHRLLGGVVQLEDMEDKLTLAGNSVHFDREFLRHQMPMLFQAFSHRIMDVSTLRYFEGDYGSGKIELDEPNKHDALADVMSSIEQFKRYVYRRKDLAAAEAGFRRVMVGES